MINDKSEITFTRFTLQIEWSSQATKYINHHDETTVPSSNSRGNQYKKRYKNPIRGYCIYCRIWSKKHR